MQDTSKPNLVTWGFIDNRLHVRNIGLNICTRREFLLRNPHSTFSTT